MEGRVPTHPHLLNPVLAEEPIFEAEGDAADIFLTPVARKIERHKLLIAAACAGACLLAAWITSLAGGPSEIKNLFLLFALAAGGVHSLAPVWKKLTAFQVDIDVLMILAAGLAAYIGSPMEGALLLFLFTLSGGLEKYAVGRTESAIAALKDLAPATAIMIEDGRLIEVPLREVQVGTHVLVRPGERIPLDGEVVEGGSTVDESAITGESVPRDCGIGDEVFAGTSNIDGRLVMRVTRQAADTTLAKIVQLVTDAHRRPSRAQRLIDRIGPAYSLGVIVLSLLTFFVLWRGLDLSIDHASYRAIALLIVASPCALLIGTPVAHLASIAGAARNGVLIKGGAILEAIARATTAAFDKTGTLTLGKIRLTDVVPAANLDRSEVLRVALALEESSTHPLARAVVEAARHEEIRPAAVGEYRSEPGQGESAVCDGRRVWVGRPESADRFAGAAISDEVASHVQRLREDGKTVSALAIDGTISLLAFADTIRADAAECIRQLRVQGVKHLVMLTGDHEAVARRVAAGLGIDEFLAEMKPQDKAEYALRTQQSGGHTIMIGDGINDAPALANADVGIAVGSVGSDVALSAADVVLMRDRIEDVAWLHRHARRTVRIVRQNIGFALAVIAVLAPFAVAGEVPLPIAVVGHEGSTVLVAINALRLLKIGR